MKNLRGKWQPKPDRCYQKKWLLGKDFFHRPGNQCSIDSNWCTNRSRRDRPSRLVYRARRCRYKNVHPIWSAVARSKCAYRYLWPTNKCNPFPFLELCNNSTEAFCFDSPSSKKQTNKQNKMWINSTSHFIQWIFVERSQIHSVIHRQQQQQFTQFCHETTRLWCINKIIITTGSHRTKRRNLTFFFLGGGVCVSFCLWIMRQATKRHQRKQQQEREREAGHGRSWAHLIFCVVFFFF